MIKNSDEGILHLSAPMVVRPARAPAVAEPQEADDDLTRAGCACGFGCFDFDGGWLGGGACNPDAEEDSTE